MQLFIRIKPSAAMYGIHTSPRKLHSCLKIQTWPLYIFFVYCVQSTRESRFRPIQIKVGSSVIITCSSNGFPEPSYIITHNDTRLVSTDKNITLYNVLWNYTGTYKCFVNNSLRSSSDFKYLNFKGMTIQGVSKKEDFSRLSHCYKFKILSAICMYCISLLQVQKLFCSCEFKLTFKKKPAQ